MNYSERIEWMQDNQLYSMQGKEYASLTSMLQDLRTEVESYVGAYMLDFAYDVQELTKADITLDRATAYLMLRECGTWLIWEEDVDERLDDLKKRYSQWIIFELSLNKTRAGRLSLKPYEPWRARLVGFQCKED